MLVDGCWQSLVPCLKQFSCQITRCSPTTIFTRKRHEDHRPSKTLTHQHSPKNAPKGKKQLTEKKLTRRFIDWRRVLFVGGDGGDGCISMRREAYIEFGGPDGGNGGNGGKIILQSAKKIKSLDRVLPTYKAENGVRGSSGNSHGKNAKHTVIEVPLGTIVRENDVKLVDLANEGDEFVAARGGAGGKGNRHFLSNENRAPQIATHGMPGEQRTFELELRVMAQAGLIGFPNAGKSTLLRALSRARPAVAAYPFTTLNPHVGMVEYDDMEQVAVADIPGLIPGAHMNKGLGHSFLKHIERCLCLLYVIDLSQPNPSEQLQHLKYELNQYHPGLADRPHAVVGNKIDLLEAKENLKTLQDSIKLPVIAISAECKMNITSLKSHLRELYDQDMKGRMKEKEKKESESRII